MGSDKQEKLSRKPASKRKGDSGSSLGCFIGLNPDRTAKDRIDARGLDPAWLENIMIRVLDQGLRFASRYDVKNDAYVCTCTRVAETFTDNQTVAAYHSSPVKSLMILLDALEVEFLGQEDWRYRQGVFDLEW